MSLDWIINYFQCQSLLSEQNIPKSFTEVEVQQYYLPGRTNILWLSILFPIYTVLPITISNFILLKKRDVLGRWFWKCLFHCLSRYYETPWGIFSVPLRPLHLPFAQIILEKQMLKNITKIRKQKIINHTKPNTSTVLREYSTLLKWLLNENIFLV